MPERFAALETEAQALRFLNKVGFALRYNATSTLPLASIYKASRDQRIAIELTNALLASGEAVETNVIADRLVLVHRRLVPAIYKLRKRFRSTRLSAHAENALGLIERDGHATSGEVRRFLGVAGQKRPDPGDIALSELQRDFWIDRGPSSVPKKGMPYLSPEGYPYRLFEKAHADLVREARSIEVTDAVQTVIGVCLDADPAIKPRKLASMFKLLFSNDELKAALAAREAR